MTTPHILHSHPWAVKRVSSQCLVTTGSMSSAPFAVSCNWYECFRGHNCWLTDDQACQFYVASFWLLPSSHFNPMMPNNTINMAQIPSVLQRVSQQSGAEVVFKSNCFEVHGLAHEVRTAIQLIAELDIVQVTSLPHGCVCNSLPSGIPS
jgi:hypothetical protein